MFADADHQVVRVHVDMGLGQQTLELGVLGFQLMQALSLRDSLPDESTILHFHHLLEKHQLARGAFDSINAFWLA